MMEGYTMDATGSWNLGKEYIEAGMECEKEKGDEPRSAS